MKTIVLVKSHSIVQLGHLYEHLFVMRLKSFMYERGLYKVVDYSIHGTTYDRSGAIEIYIELYSREAILLADQIAQLEIDLGEDNALVSSAIMQIEAEEDHKLHISDKASLMEYLTILDSGPWTRLEDFDKMDSKARRRKNDIIYLTDRPQASPKTIKIEYQATKQFIQTHRHLLPLLNMLVRILALTSTDVITKERGFYAGEFYCIPNQQKYTSELLVAKLYSHDVDAAAILSTARRVTDEVTTDRTINRIVAEILRYSSGDDAYATSDHERIENETGVLIGLKGWQGIATVENVAIALDSLKVAVKYGGTKLT